MIIRRETPEDTEAIHALALAEFARPDRGGPALEARLVRELRADGDTVPSLCLVAERDEQVVGHVRWGNGRGMTYRCEAASWRRSS